MSRSLSLRNRQRVCRVDPALLRRITRWIFREQLRLAHFDLCLHLVAAPEMARLNETFLRHSGSTDVITFDYTGPEDHIPSPEIRMGRGDRGGETPQANAVTPMSGELFICLDEAVTQARQFRTTWQREVVRYLIHGLLHLCRHDDLRPAARRRMKREENRLLRRISSRFRLVQLGTRNPKHGPSGPALRRPDPAG